MDKAKLKELEEHGHYYSVPRGVSMWPMLKNTESIVDIVPFEGKLKKYDVALYYQKDRRKYVLHRVLGLNNTHYIFYGDNCWSKEIVPFCSVIGVASQFKRDTRSEWISVRDKRYLLYVHLWCDFLPLRRLLLWSKDKLIKLKQTGAALDMLYLVTCTVNNQKPELSKLKKIDLQELYNISKFHNLTNIVYTALETAYGNNLPECDIIENWREEKDKSVRKNILFDAEYKVLSSWCEKNGIWHMPLKGAILKDLYPKYGMRQMADVDVLFDEAYRLQIKEWFAARGYEVDLSASRDAHDSYFKSPVYNFEMHTALIPAHEHYVSAEYYTDVKNKLIKDEGKQYSCHFSDEDFYIYFIAHTFKHYACTKGTGFRSLLDCYLFRNAKRESFNVSYVEKELNSLGILEFEQEFRLLAQKVFSSSCDFNTNILSKEELKMWKYLLFSGTYGTSEHRINYSAVAKLQKQDNNGKGIFHNLKLRYIMNKLFPDINFMGRWCKAHAPFFLKHKKFMPMAYVYRILTKDVTKFEWMAEVKAVLNMKIK